MSKSIIKTETEKKEFDSQNTGSLNFNKYTFKTGILHEKLNISKPAVISYNDFLDLIVPFSQEPKPHKDEFDQEISQFVQELEQKRSNNKSDLKLPISNGEANLTIPASPINSTLSLNKIINSKSNNTSNKEIFENEVENETIFNTYKNEGNGGKISSEVHNNLDLCQEECFENVITCEKNNISILCKKNNKKLTNTCNHQQGINMKICLVDCINNMKKNFVCSKNLLIEKMEVFSEINNNKNYSLDEIIVKCDLNTFGWIMHWMKEGTDYTKPVISCYNVISILIVANLFKINPLVEQCIIFFRTYINNIIAATQDFSNVSTQLIIKLTEQFSNTELEDIVDKSDKLQTSLYCNFILFLANRKPRENMKHFSSLKSIFCCKFCHKLLPKGNCSTILCSSECNIVTLKGNIRGLHVRDKTWNLTSHVRAVYEKLQSWRLVYWQLWGSCHFLFCNVCQMLYPLYQASWCPYHPGDVEYFKLDDEGNKVTLPIGRYECCGQTVYKYECIQNPNCCSFKSHIPILKSTDENEINHLFLKHKNLISFEPPQLCFPESLTQLVRSHTTCEDTTIPKRLNNFWWLGIQLIPRHFKHPGPLIPRLWEESSLKCNKNKSEKIETKCHSITMHVPYNKVSTSQFYKQHLLSNTKARKNIDKTNSLQTNLKVFPEESNLNKAKVKNSQASVKKKKKSKKELDEAFVYNPHSLILWNVQEAIRYNQDNQRDYEDWVFSKINSKLTSANHNAESYATVFQPSGGSYFRIENEWQEKHKKLFGRKLDKKSVNLRRGNGLYYW